VKDLRAYVSRRVIIETDTMTVEGIVVRLTATSIELEHAAQLPESGERKPIDGVFVVPAARVAWVQVP
jgi:hypothetical protein